MGVLHVLPKCLCTAYEYCAAVLGTHQPGSADPLSVGVLAFHFWRFQFRRRGGVPSSKWLQVWWKQNLKVFVVEEMKEVNKMKNEWT